MAGFNAKDLLGRDVRDTNDYRSIRDNFPYQPTLFLGLGGTGCQAVSKIKSLFNDVYLPTAQKGTEANVGRVPQMYAFLGFDTNASEVPPNLQRDSEWVHLGIGSMGDFYKSNAKEDIYRGWVCPNLPKAAVVAGAAGYRNLGKICLYFNIDTFAEKILAARDQVLRVDARIKLPQPVVYVLCSLAGGTGSGMFLDASFMIKKYFPTGTRVVGVVAIPEGLSTDPIDRQKVRVGTFCALRELDAFMTGRSGHADDDAMVRYPQNFEGEIGEPFQECYLIHQQRDDGVQALPTQGHLSSFMARSVFMMSAYAFRGDNPDYRGYLVNKEDRLWLGTSGGTFFRYLVPAMGQMHFPIEKCVQLFVMDAARDYFKYQSGGKQYEGRADAERFISQHRLGFHEIRDRLAREPGTDQPLTPYRFGDVISTSMHKKKRYQNRDSVLALGDLLPDRRLEQVMTVLRANVAGLVASVLPAIEQETNRLLVNHDFLYRGTLDFVDDLIAGLRDVAAAATTENKSGVQSDYDELGARWQNLRPLVQNVVTANGAWDRLKDHMQLGKAQTMYVALLNQADEIILRKARNDLALEAIHAVLAELAKLRDVLVSTFETKVPAAIALIEEKRQVLVEALLQSELGQADSVDNIRSLNVLNEDWRKAHFADQDHFRPRQVLGNLLAQGWHPTQMLTAMPPKDMTPAAFVAAQVIDRIIPSAEKDLALRPAEIMGGNGQDSTASPAQIITGQIQDLLQPQLPITLGHRILGAPVAKIYFCGGLDKETNEALRKGSEMKDGDKFLQAESWEPNKLSFFAAHLPVSLAGCAPVKATFESEYLKWRREKEKTAGGDQKVREDLMRYLCFPGSDQWPNPASFHRDIRDEFRHFAMALAVSEVFEPSAGDLQVMNTMGKDPKTKRYGLFQIGRAAFWLWPFFEPSVEAAATPATTAGALRIGERHVKLGSNIQEAYKSYLSDQRLIEHARKWSDWMTNSWTSVFSAPELKAAMALSLQSIATRRAATRDEAQGALWDDLIRVLQAWVDETL